MSKRFEEIKDEYAIKLSPDHDYISNYETFKNYFASRHIDWFDSFNSEVLLTGEVPTEAIKAEIETANQNHFQSWCIGDRVLRTETAPVVALSVLNYHFSIK